MKLLDAILGQRKLLPEPHHYENVPGTAMWVVVRDRDGHKAAGPFDSIAEAAACADALSAGRPWRYGPDARTWKVERGYLSN